MTALAVNIQFFAMLLAYAVSILGFHAANPVQHTAVTVM